MPARPRRLLAALAAILTATTVLLVGPGAPASGQEVVAAAVSPIGAPASTSAIRLVASTTKDGWRYEQYRNPAYPCAVSGASTFTIATKVGTPTDAVRPLWVYLHGGGFGYFDATGQPQPGANLMVEETAARQIGFLERGDSASGGILPEVRSAATNGGYRMLAVSMCHHDGYMGGGQTDPDNPAGRTVNGLAATKAAIAFTLRTVPTDDFVLHGTSSGSFGAWSLAWALDELGLPATAVIGDSGMFNEAYKGWVDGEPGCGNPDGDGYKAFRARTHPALTDPANRPGALVASGRIASPVLDVWVPNDPIWCGEKPVACPVGGATFTMGATDCMHEEMRRAIVAQGPLSRSRSMRVCVEDPGSAGTCDRHVPTVITGATNTDPLQPADFQQAIMGWVAQRLDDDGVAAPSDRTSAGSFAAAATRDFLGSDNLRRADALATALTAGQPKIALLRRLTTSEPWLVRIVGDLYLDTLGRPGDAGGVAYWVGVLARGERTVAEVAARFYASPEYYAGLGGGTDASWVTDLYDAILHRAPEPGGVGYWVGEVARRGRSSVALRLFQSGESAAARVRELYQELLGRSPSAGDVAYWSPQVVARGDLTLAVNLANSPEYQSRAETRYP